MRLRQIALVAADLDASTEALREVLGLGTGFQDPGVAEFGLENAVMPVGDTFLEVVSPARAGTTAGRLLERRGGDGGYMVIVQSQDRLADRKRVDGLGVRVVWEVALPDAAAIHLHPRDVGGAILSLDWMDPVESWRWGGPDWAQHVRTDRCREIVGAELQADDPAAMAARWAEVCGTAARLEAPGVHRIDFGAGGDGGNGGFVRFHEDRDGRGEGVSGLIVAPAEGGEAVIRRSAAERGLIGDDDEIRIAGTRIGFS